MARISLSSPWVVYYRKVEALFSKDEEVNVIFDEDHQELKLYVDSVFKANALSSLFPENMEFGTYLLHIIVIPPNGHECNKDFVIEDAFIGNDALAYIRTIQVGTNPMTFVVFAKEVVQYFTDDLGDIHGIHSTLYQDIAKELFGDLDGIYFCTDVNEAGYLGIPLGEWP